MQPRRTPVRLLIYAILFVGLMVFLYAIQALASLLLSQVIPATRSIVSPSALRSEVSYALAALLVATPLSLVVWRLVEGQMARDEAERRAPERHLFLALTAGIGAAVSLFAIHTILLVVLSLPADHNATQVLKDLVPALLQLVVYGPAMVLAARTAWRENRIQDPAHDLVLAILSGVALAFLATGAFDALTAIITEIESSSRGTLLGLSTASLVRTWAQSAAWMLSGGPAWASLTLWTRSRSRAGDFRLPYLYAVLAVSATMTLISGTDAFYEILRRLLGYHTSLNWHFLQGTLPWLVVGGALWAYHWRALRAESEGDDAAAVIPPERRLGIAGYAFIGTAMAAPAAASLLWLLLDALFSTRGVSLGGAGWWRDRLCAGVAILAVGLVLWAPSWRLLQRASDPESRSSASRRWLLGGTTLIAALVTIGFTIAFLWTLLQALLGAGLDARAASNLFKYLGTALIAILIVGFYGTCLRSDLRVAPGRRKVRIMALVEPGGGSSLDMLRSEGFRVEVTGYSTRPVDGMHLPLDAVREWLAAPNTDRVMLVLGPAGGIIVPYTGSPHIEEDAHTPRNAPLPAAGS